MAQIVFSLRPKIRLPEPLELNFRLGYERQRQIDASDKRMTQSLQRRQSFTLVNLENLLNKIYELVYL